MSNQISVLRYQGDGTDYVWAIDITKNVDGGHNVWFGENNKQLAKLRTSPNTDWNESLNARLAEGYVVDPDVTIDLENDVLSSLVQETEGKNVIQTSLWYRISNFIIENDIVVFLKNISDELAKIDMNEAKKLKELPVYKSLQQGKLTGGAEFKEGPLSVLLLYALRRHFKESGLPHVSGDLVQIADDSNNLLPEKYEDLSEYIDETCEALFVDNGWLKEGQSLIDGGERLLSIADQHNMSHYVSVSNIKQIAIVMGCLDAPIDLTGIQTETKPAFF